MRKTLLFILILIANSSNAQISDFKSVDFTIADNVAKLNAGSSLDNLALLAHNLTYKLPTDVEKFRAIYMWVCSNIKGDPNQDNLVIKKLQEFKNDSIGYLKWNKEYKKIALKKLVNQKKTMCSGYSYLIQELCYLANIECEIINGYGRTTSTNADKLELKNHSWNAVKLNNKWYLCDATWSSGYFDDYLVFITEYVEGYFLTDPELFAKSHYPSQKKWLLNDALIEEKFIATPLVYSEAYKYKIVPISPQKMNVVVKKNDEVNFSFKTLKTNTIDDISLVQFIGVKERVFDIYDIKNEGQLIEFKHKFESKGSFDVHLKINDDIVATYVIKVKS